MNDKIANLADQATMYAIADNSSMMFEVWKRRYTEKLAELIAWDCVLACHKHEDINGSPTDCILEIKKQFGL